MAVNKRKYSWWDSIYTGKDVSLSRIGWSFKNNKGPANGVFSSQDLSVHISDEGLSRFKCDEVRFLNCSFTGKFDQESLGFRKCTFIGCDFGESEWFGVKFSECRFESCSLTLAEFSSCQFYACEWEKITVSGTETKFSESLITNPGEFISAAYTNLNKSILSAKGTSRKYQVMRLENTKAKIARVLMKCCEHYGDDKAYYDSLKTYLMQSLKAKRIESAYNFAAKKNVISNGCSVAACQIELLLLAISGFVNSWGRSIARPVMFGFAVLVFFAFIYSGFGKDFGLGVVKSFDITFLVGYTKHATLQDGFWNQVIYAVNAFVGLWWYAIFVPTVINRISRIN